MNRHNPISKQAVSCGIQSCSREENDALYERVRQGDSAAKRRMVEGNMALVITLVAAHLREYPFLDYLRDDLISEGFLTLTDKIEHLSELPEIEEPNPTGYLATSITRYISAFAWEDSIISAPRTMQTQIGRHIVPQVVPLDNVEPLTDPFQAIFLLEEIEGCCQDPLDHQIISLRLEGYRDHEIGIRLQCSQQHVSHLRKRLYKRFCQTTDLAI